MRAPALRRKCLYLAWLLVAAASFGVSVYLMVGVF